MGWTDTHFRFLCRLLSSRTLLYSEMVSIQDLLRQETRPKELRCHLDEAPVVLQLGGSCPQGFADAVGMLRSAGELDGYCAINLNCGCPSPRVATEGVGGFGARMMHDPQLVLRSSEEISRAANGLPVSVKCRLGTDEVGGYEALRTFVRTVSQGSVRHFVVHARDCVLEGLSPEENRKVPPLRPRWVHQLQSDFPHLSFTYNGDGEDESWEDLPAVSEVMIGRAAYNRPWMLREADEMIFGETGRRRTRREVIETYLDRSERLGYVGGGEQEYGVLGALLTLFAEERGGKVGKEERG
ncbi:hypothetical protein GUITHDRAFT_158591 [Guillardia theta CCMP2712]|uniref:tRNA-dihydrouridine synthase n=1 Tax=Guillardia theta (strain CCMP2712) TaxID=905079 RepID=L1IME3_GUITC|nr:hypothetical protein GUITHDRAFT_158591 [Guillardia theta CCMP2712]EKX37416.1 hypothetical protein GUITHDRAFT_158591 [Guillardia theta CCMP2712]|eukprot:XP_005824396.1 hypothetical protein GUITHDRAFT_158591 [Guillardia theta CCMP2712]